MVLESCAKLHKLETKLKVKLRKQRNLKLNFSSKNWKLLLFHLYCVPLCTIYIDIYYFVFPVWIFCLFYLQNLELLEIRYNYCCIEYECYIGKESYIQVALKSQYKDPINKTFELIQARTILYLQGSGIFPQIPQILHCSSYGSVYANWIYSGKCQRLAYLQV